MALRETLQRILTEYAKAKGEPLENHPLAQFIRHDAAQAVEAGLGELGTGVVVEGGPGQGNWAAVPWITVHYDIATDFAVLCSNCHRMIHRTVDPSNLAQFRDMVSQTKRKIAKRWTRSTFGFAD
jgi:MrcB-like, N-terminal domain